jgi:hypothetical protein
VTTDSPHDSPPAPFFHADSGAVRFWVRVPDGSFIGATIGKQALHFRFRAELSGDNALAIYEAHRSEIAAAVLRRVANGSIEPVMLRESDLRPA